MNLKENLKELREKASELAGKHNETLDHVVERAGSAVDTATLHKFSTKIGQGTEKAKHVVDDFAAKQGEPARPMQPVQPEQPGGRPGPSGDL